MMRKRIAGVFVALLACAFAAQAETFDLVICGSSSAGIAAAVEAKRHGLKAVVLSATPRIGGLTTGGLGQTDIGCKEAYGGISREFYRAIKAHYADPTNWRWQKPGDYRPGGQSAYARQEDAMWTFEPSAALAVLESWEKRDGLDIRRGERLDRTPGTQVEVSFGDATVRTTADAEGRWSLELPALEASATGRPFTVKGTSTIVLKDVAVGDLWFVAGPETLGGVRKTPGKYPAFPEGIGPLFGSASAPRVASVWWDSYSQLSRRPEMHPWRKGTDGTSTPVGVLDATWPGCDIRLFTPAEGRNALHYNGMAHGLVRIPVAGLAWSGAAAQADLDALAAAWRRAWGNAALPFRRLGKDDLNEGRMK